MKYLWNECLSGVILYQSYHVWYQLYCKRSWKKEVFLRVFLRVCVYYFRKHKWEQFSDKASSLHWTIFFLKFWVYTATWFYSLITIYLYAFYLNLYQYSKIIINETYTFLKSWKTIVVQKDENRCILLNHICIDALKVKYISYV